MTGKPRQRTLLIANPYLELNNQGQVLQLELKHQQHIMGCDRDVSAHLVVPDEW